MNCRQLIDFISDYRNGELPEPVRAEFERHLQMCQPCKTFLDTYGCCIEMAKDACDCDDNDPVPDKVPEELVQAILKARKKGE